MTSQIKFRSLPFIAAIIVFCLIFSIGLWLIIKDRQAAQVREKELLDRLTDSFVRETERRVDKAIAITRVLASDMRLLGPQRVVEKFDQFAADLLDNTDIEHLIIGLAPDGIVSHVYPADNHRVLGLDLNKDPKRIQHVENTIETGKTTLSGPYDLIAGGRGFVARNPISLEQDGKSLFWGFITVAIRQDFLFPQQDLDKFSASNIAVSLSTIDPATRQETLLFDTGVSTDKSQQLISVPGGIWRLETSSLTTRQVSTVSLLWNFVTAVLFALFAWFIARYPQNLREQIRLTAQQIQAQEKFSHDLIASLPDGVVVTDIEGDICYFNPRFALIINKAVAEGESLISLVGDRVNNSSMQQFLTSRVNLRQFDFQITMTLEPRGDFQLSCSVFNTAQGQVLLWFFRDVSEISRINRTLRHVSATRADMLRLLPDPMAFFNKKGELMECNPGFQSVFADYVDVDAGFSCHDFEQVLLNHTQNKASFVPVTLQPHDLQQVVFSDEVVMPGPTKRIFERTVRFDDSEGNVGSIMHFHDVTAAQEVDRMKTEFLSTAAHELRTPLANIFGYTELLLKAQFDKPRQDELLEIVYNQTKRLSAIIDDLLDLARIEARVGEAFHYAWHKIADLVEGVVKEIKFDLETHHFEYSVAGDIGEIWCDGDKIAQVIENLLSNACKYSPHNTRVSLSCEIERREQMMGCLIRVSDQGMGMNKQDLDHVFDRFYRADTSGQVPGTGLGMAIVKEIISHHQGQIAIDSEPGQGTTVTIWLPQQQLESHTQPEVSCQTV